MSTTDSFLPDPDRRIRDSDEELAHEVAGDGPDALFPDDAGRTGTEDAVHSEDPAAPLEANPLFRTPHPGDRLTAEQLEADLSDG
jgi:hypothetical protein